MRRRQGFRCFECDARANHAHHVVPFSLGGTRTIPLCEPCHAKAHGQLPRATSDLIKAGMKKAKDKGTHVGRPRKDLPLTSIRFMSEAGLSINEIALELNLTPYLVRRALKDK
jgi:hypothetical protein